MPRTLPARPDWLRPALAVGRPVKADREARVLRGYVVAQLGAFKSRRGQFTEESLARIKQLMDRAEPAGLKSRFTHPSMSDDGLGTFLGRSHAAVIDGNKVRADLHFDATASRTPKGDLAGYVLDLADSDPDALSSSLVLRSEKVQVLDERGRPKVDDTGEEIPPVWLPTHLHASDIVDTGDAVDGLLSAGVDVGGLPLSALWYGAELLDGVFPHDCPRDVVEARLAAWVERYLALRYGEPGGPPPGTTVDTLRRRLTLKLKGKGLTLPGATS